MERMIGAAAEQPRTGHEEDMDNDYSKYRRYRRHRDYSHDSVDVPDGGESRKNDRKDGKPMWELLPLATVEEVVKVYTYGAEKYGPNMWQGLDDGYNRYKAALLRHIVAYEKGEAHDKESGLHSLAHAAWNAIAMLYLATQEEEALKRTEVASSEDVQEAQRVLYKPDVHTGDDEVLVVEDEEETEYNKKKG